MRGGWWSRDILNLRSADLLACNVLNRRGGVWTYSSQECLGDNHGIWRGFDVDPPDHIYLLPEVHLARDLHPLSVLECYTVNVTVQHEKIPVVVSFQPGMLFNFRHGCGPACLVVLRNLFQLVGQPFFAWDELYYGEGLHHVCYGNDVASDREVDRDCCAAEGGQLGEIARGFGCFLEAIDNYGFEESCNDLAIQHGDSSTTTLQI